MRGSSPAAAAAVIKAAPWRCPAHLVTRANPTVCPNSQAKALVAWKTLPRAPRAAALSPQDREVLAVQHNRRLFDTASKACLGVVKTMMTQKVRRCGGSCVPVLCLQRPSQQFQASGRALPAANALPPLPYLLWPRPALTRSSPGPSTTRWTSSASLTMQRWV